MKYIFVLLFIVEVELSLFSQAIRIDYSSITTLSKIGNTNVSVRPYSGKTGSPAIYYIHNVNNGWQFEVGYSYVKNKAGYDVYFRNQYNTNTGSHSNNIHLRSSLTKKIMGFEIGASAGVIFSRVTLREGSSGYLLYPNASGQDSISIASKYNIMPEAGIFARYKIKTIAIHAGLNYAHGMFRVHNLKTIYRQDLEVGYIDSYTLGSNFRIGIGLQKYF